MNRKVFGVLLFSVVLFSPCCSMNKLGPFKQMVKRSISSGAGVRSTVKKVAAGTILCGVGAYICSIVARDFVIVHCKGAEGGEKGMYARFHPLEVRKFTNKFSLLSDKDLRVVFCKLFIWLNEESQRTEYDLLTGLELHKPSLGQGVLLKQIEEHIGIVFREIERRKLPLPTQKDIVAVGNEMLRRQQESMSDTNLKEGEA